MDLSWLNPIGKIVDGVGSYFTDKQKFKAEITLAKHTAKVARIERGDATERDYDMQVLQNAATTIMDEVLIVWVLVIVSMLFWSPATAAIAIAGFTALSTAPVFFQIIFVGIFVSKLGLRFMFTGRNLFGKLM